MENLSQDSAKCSQKGNRKQRCKSRLKLGPLILAKPVCVNTNQKLITPTIFRAGPCVL